MRISARHPLPIHLAAAVAVMLVTAMPVGTPASTCNDWTSLSSTTGIGGATTLADATWWASFTNGSCAQGLKLYCLQG